MITFKCNSKYIFAYHNMLVAPCKYNNKQLCWLYNENILI